MSRAELESACEDLLARALKPLDAVLQQANVTLDQGACVHASMSLFLFSFFIPTKLTAATPLHSSTVNRQCLRSR